MGYGSCYTEDVGKSFEREGWTNCSKLGYYITGVYRGSGNWLKNIDKFRCCQMATGNETTSKILRDMKLLLEIMTGQCKVANMHSLNSKLMMNYTGKEQSFITFFFQLTISFGDQLKEI